MIKKTALYLLLLAMLVSACSPAAPVVVETPVSEVQTEEPAAITEEAPPAVTVEQAAVTAYPALAVEEQPTPLAVEAYPSPQGEGQAPASGVTIYKIVPGESQASYEVGETFFNDNNRFSTAIGVTNEINGEISLDTVNPQNSQIGTITVDLSQLRSDSNRRDGTIRDRFLESGRFPLATFTPIGISGLPESYTEGEEISFQVSGDLTVREATQPITFEVTAKVEGGALIGSAISSLLMSDFGVGPITMAGILGTEDLVKITVNFVARP